MAGRRLKESISIPDGRDPDGYAVELSMSAETSNTIVMRRFIEKLFPGTSLEATLEEARRIIDRVQAGDYSYFEDTLVSQFTLMSGALTSLMNEVQQNVAAGKLDKAEKLMNMAATAHERVCRSTLIITALERKTRKLLGARARGAVDVTPSSVKNSDDLRAA